MNFAILSASRGWHTDELTRALEEVVRSRG